MVHVHNRMWEDLRHFLAVARAGSFSGGARLLGTHYATLIRRVARLEEELQGPLLDRRGPKPTLTPLGERVRLEVEQMEEHAARVAMLASINDASEGTVRLALTETLAALVVIPHVLPPLLAAHPALHIELIVSDEAADLARREADLALRFFVNKSGDLITRRLARFSTGAVAHRDLAARLAQEQPQRWPWITVRSPSGTSPEERWLRAGWTVEPRLTTSSFHAQYEAVRAGLGVAILPALMLLAYPSLVVLELPGAESPAVDLHLVTPRTLRRAPRIRLLTDALVSVFERVERSDRDRRPADNGLRRVERSDRAQGRRPGDPGRRG